MGKVEILTLIAGVVLSIALALIVVPMFSESSDMVKKTQIKHEVASIINHYDLYKMDKSQNESIDFMTSYKNHMKNVHLSEDDVIYLNSGNSWDVTMSSDMINVISFKIDEKNKLKSYDDLNAELSTSCMKKNACASSSGVSIEDFEVTP